MSDTSKIALLKKLKPSLIEIDASAGWQITGPTIRARKCDIYKVSNPNHQLALKVYKNNIASSAAPHIQYDAMRRCNEAAFTNPLLRAPNALAFLPDERAILMEWHAATALGKTLWKKLYSPDQRLEMINSAGKWLRAFHDLSDVKLLPLDGHKLAAKLKAQIEKKTAAQDQLKNSRHFQRALSRFRDAAASCNEPTPHALLHGDFTPSNLLVNSGNIIGMDMWGVRHAPIYEDITRMLAYLGVVSPYALWPAPLSPDSPLMQAFIKGYANEQIDIQSKAFHIVLHYQQLRRWLVYADKKTTQPFSLKARWQLIQSQRLCLQTLNWLDHCSSKP